MSERTFSIKTEFITLGQLLKALGIVGSGAEVKLYLLDYRVKINGEFDDRRGRKLWPGDLVEFDSRRRVRIT